MPSFRKKPVVIEAMQWNGTAASAGDIIDWVLATPNSQSTPSFYEVNETETRKNNELHISTLEGVMIANPHDYIIIGVQGEVYPCKPDIFEQTYDETDLKTSRLIPVVKTLATQEVIGAGSYDVSTHTAQIAINDGEWRAGIEAFADGPSEIAIQIYGVNRLRTPNS